MNIAVDFGGTNIKIGLVSGDTVLARTSLPANSDVGLLKRLPAVETAIKGLLAHYSGQSECLGVGIATPGLVDTERKLMLSINDKYADAVGYPFAEWVEDTFGLPFVMENDARAALIGETSYGAAKGETDAVLMTFGTGIGTAAVVGGTVLRGRHYQAGILGGHMTTDIHGKPCNCGNLGCLEAQAGHWALDETVHSHPDFSQSMLANASRIDYLTVLEAARAGDKAATAIYDGLIEHWSSGIINMIHAYDPETVILSGGLMKSKQDVLPRLMERVHRLAWTPWGSVKFIVSEDPDTSVLLGVTKILEDHIK